MNDELRDRIAEAIYKNQDFVLGEPSELFGDAAQAIIDDLHLEAYDFTTHDGHTTNHVHGWWKTQ